MLARGRVVATLIELGGDPCEARFSIGDYGRGIKFEVDPKQAGNLAPLLYEEVELRIVASAIVHIDKEESRRLHREYNALVAAQLAGAKNGADVRRLTDECSAKGIVLVPGGEK